MKNRIKAIIIISCLLLSLVACDNKQTTFDGSRTGNANQFLMDYKVLNISDSQEIEFEAGDAIDVDIVVKSGRTDILIQKEGSDPIYRGNDVDTASFQVIIEETGTYTITVTGSDNASGSVSFVKVKNE